MHRDSPSRIPKKKSFLFRENCTSCISFSTQLSRSSFFFFLNCSYLLGTIYQGKYLFIVITLSLIFSGLLNQKTRTMAMPANLVMGILAMIFNPCQEMMMTRMIFPPPPTRRRPTLCHLPIVYHPHLPHQRPPPPLKWH